MVVTILVALTIWSILKGMAPLFEAVGESAANSLLGNKEDEDPFKNQPYLKARVELEKQRKKFNKV
jgi:hypothetical protein